MTREDIEYWRSRFVETLEFTNEENAEIGVLCDMALSALPSDLPPQMLEALAITEEAVAAQVESEAIALLRELNDAALPIPDALQARVDALLDRAEEKP